MVVGAMIIGAVVASIIQLFTMSDRNSDYNAAFTQVQNAGYWVSHDAVQITEEPFPDGFPNGNGKFPVTLEWYDGTANHTVVYTLDASSGELKRKLDSDSPIVIAQYIVSDATKTSCTWDAVTKTLTLVITAQVGDQTVTRTYKVDPRPSS